MGVVFAGVWFDDRAGTFPTFDCVDGVFEESLFAEDAGEFQQKEYFMREYRIIVEKHDGSLKPGAKIMGTPGPFAIR